MAVDLTTVEVNTIDPKTDEVIKTNLSQLNFHSNRVWLMKHISWAISSGYSIEIIPEQAEGE